MQNEKGFLLYANYSDNINYATLAVCCALSIKSSLVNNNVTVVLDKKTKSQLQKSHSKEIITKAFDNVIVTTKKFQSLKRRHFNTPWETFASTFNNKPRILAYNHSPYKETILLDTDVIVMNNDFDSIWGCDSDFLMNRKAIDLQGKPFGSIEDQKLSINGIPMYWATQVYFKKGKFSKTFFDLVNYIKDEYNYFRFLYEFPDGYYRNDYVFSIAAHVMNGYINGNQRSFPIDTILTSYQEDNIAYIKDSKELIFLSTNMDEKWKTVLVNVKDMNVHIMNKRELLRISDEFIRSCMEKL